MNHLLLSAGEIFDVVGLARDGKEFMFVPALVDGELPPRHELMHPLQDQLGSAWPVGLRLFFDDDCGYLRDSCWVRARLPVVFNFAPPRAPRIEPKPGLIDCTFVAVAMADTERTAHTFACSDGQELNAGLRFFRPPPKQNVQARIAREFWDLLLASPEDLADFDDFVLVGSDIDRCPCRVTFAHGRFLIEQVGDAVG